MSDEQLRQKVREGMASFARAFSLPASTLLGNVDLYFNRSQGELKHERLQSETIQE